MRRLAFRILLSNPGRWSKVDDVLSDLSSYELDEYQAFLKLNPFGHDLILRMIAQLTMITAAGLGVKDCDIDTFLPKFREPDADESDDDYSMIGMFPGGAEIIQQLKSERSNGIDSQP